MKLADADPPSEEVVGRIRRWDMAMTKVKTTELLAELPTKRLLMKYTQGFVDRANPPGNLQVNLLYCLLSATQKPLSVSTPRSQNSRVTITPSVVEARESIFHV